MITPIDDMFIEASCSSDRAWFFARAAIRACRAGNHGLAYVDSCISFGHMQACIDVIRFMVNEFLCCRELAATNEKEVIGREYVDYCQDTLEEIHSRANETLAEISMLKHNVFGMLSRYEEN